MANALYNKAKEKFLGGDIDWLANTIKVALVDSAYTHSAAHEFRSSLSGSEVAQSPALANKDATNGVADADDVTLPSVTGNAVEALVIYVDTGNAATDSLIAHLDTGTGFPYTPDGGDVLISWSDAAEKIFAL